MSWYAGGSVCCLCAVPGSPDSPIFFEMMCRLSFYDGLLMEFMSFFDKKDNRHLERGEEDFSLTFVKQQIIKGLTLEIIS